MNLNFHFILPALIILLIGVPLNSAYQASYYDLNLIDLQVMDLQVLSMDDTPGYYFDNADLVKITINVSNNGLDYFVVSDKMFKILVMEPNLAYNNQKDDGFEIVDNYYTSYDDELEVRYDNLNSRELFNECDDTNDRIINGESKIFTICYDVLRIWNNEVLNLDGTKKHYLVMMDNTRTTSCPNCKKILLSTSDPSQKYYTPSWVQNIFEWHKQGIISDQEYQNSIAYLRERGIITDNTSKKEIQLLTTLEEKNMQLKEHQARLSLAQQTNLYVSSINFYESIYSDEYSGVLCKKQNNIVTLSGDYTNNSIYYDALFFKLLLFDDFGDVVATGLSKMVDVASKEFRHFYVSTPYEGKINHCLVMVDYKSKISQPQEKTILKLHDMGTVSHNGGQPIVFSGRLDTTSGEAVSDAEILIKSDGGCPDDGIIANGTTDKNGRYWILTLTKIWDPSDNLIKIHAEFLGDEQFYPSKSQIEVVVVYPSHAEKCVS